ncbi:MAG: glycoside hydrolase family 88 protein [Maribacter sp.]
MKTKFVPLVIIIACLFGCKEHKEATSSTKATENRVENKRELINRVFKISEKQYNLLIDKITNNEPLLQPRGITKNDNVRLVPYYDWTSGFFPGSLWYIYKYNQKDKWKANAIKFTYALDSVKYITNSHDVGFMLDCSYGNAYSIANDTLSKRVIVEGATSLITRYRPKIGVIQSWDTTPNMGWISEKGWNTPVIIDNMMNLELLYKAFQFTNDSTFYKIASNHAKKTLKNHFREDYSSFHVVDYDSKTSKVRNRQTAQGYSDPSSWARGQSWGLYGFTQTFANTKDSVFLDQAKNIAHYIMGNKKIPKDLIPYWDYDAPNIPNEPRDASAAAITASALLTLQQYVPEEQKTMIAYAEKILRRLSSNDYLADIGSNQGFLLKHSVGNIHTDEENDEPLNYADYYYLEALLKWQEID